METEQQQQYFNNQEYVAQGSFMMSRLKTEPLIKGIRLFLQSTELVVYQNEDGSFTEKIIPKGKPLANDDGVMRICNLVSMVVNSHNVQGNLKSDHYWFILERIRKEIAEHVVINCYEWQVRDEDLNQVINSIMHLIELFLTRTVDNKERESYMASVRTNETIREQGNTGLMGFAKGVGK